MLFYPCMNEPVYREAQIGWASLTNAVIMNLPASAMRRYSEYYFRKDIFAPSNATREQCQLNFMRVEDIMSYERFRQTEHYQFLRSIGFDYQSDLVLKAPDGRNTACLAFFRTAEEGDFTDGQAEFFPFLSDYISPLYLSSVHSSTFVSVYPMLDLLRI